MRHFIDRRLNPKDKSLANRQRFLRRARAEIKDVIDRAIKDRKIAEADAGETVTLDGKGIDEPRFERAIQGGTRTAVLPGNREYAAGDRIKKSDESAGEGAGGGESGDGADAFRFTLTRSEFLDLFFDDLELPDLVKSALKDLTVVRPRRVGFTAQGSATNLDILRTLRNAQGRRLALGRPGPDMLAEIEARLAESGDEAARAELEERLRRVPFLDPVDLRYRRFEPQPQPKTNAVMFCLMDVSGSMGEREKDLAKRFFILLHLFLKRRYERIATVFIRHTHTAQEVDEETFFRSRETGGTVVSSALAEMQRIIAERFPPQEWNIYAAQASDGDNYSADADRCVSLLGAALMPLVQYYAYVEILDEREMELFRSAETGTALWRAYRRIAADWPNFAMKRVATPADIYPVLRELFQRQATGARA